MFVGAYIIPYSEGSCLYFSTFPAIFCLSLIDFSRSSPHYSCGKFELLIILKIINQRFTVKCHFSACVRVIGSGMIDSVIINQLLLGVLF